MNLPHRTGLNRHERGTKVPRNREVDRVDDLDTPPGDFIRLLLREVVRIAIRTGRKPRRPGNVLLAQVLRRKGAIKDIELIFRQLAWERWNLCFCFFFVSISGSKLRYTKFLAENYFPRFCATIDSVPRYLYLDSGCNSQNLARMNADSSATVISLGPRPVGNTTVVISIRLGYNRTQTILWILFLLEHCVVVP